MLGSIVKVKKWKDIITGKRQLKDGRVKINKTLSLKRDKVFVYEDDIIVVKSQKEDIANLDNAYISKEMVDEISNYTELLNKAINYIFQEFLEFGSFIPYKAKTYIKLLDSLVMSIQLNDFTNYSDDDIMIVSTVLNQFQEYNASITIETLEVSIELNMDIVTSYIMFNLEYGIIQGQSTKGDLDNASEESE